MLDQDGKCGIGRAKLGNPDRVCPSPRGGLSRGLDC
jgi:hypothetical protein